MKSLYVTLPSQGGKGNTTSTFTVELPHELDLIGEWEVGVVEVLYPTSWYNVYERNNVVEICYNGDDPECGTASKTYKIEPGYYDKPDGILKQLNAFVSFFLNEENQPFSESTGYVNYRPRSKVKNATITIHPDVADMLGFEDFIFHMSTKQGKLKPADVMQNFYVYTDIIQPQIVGNVRADLLCIIPAEERTLKPARYSTQAVHYIPLQKHHLTSISIHIKDVQGERIAFASGHSVVKLHFRRQTWLCIEVDDDNEAMV